MTGASSIAAALSCGSNSRCACGRPPRRSPRGLTWRTHCPVHSDAHASLDVTETPDGKVLVICRSAGCSQKDVIADLRARNLWNGVGDNMGTPHKHERIVATFDYRSVDGTLLFQVVRFDPKDFRQRRSDGNGGWIWNLNGVDRVPYRLPELLAAVASGQRVYITEGEKDADRLLHLGLAATTNPGGAGKWKLEFVAHFKGARVAIPPDNDAPGAQHAHQIAQSLHDVAAEVKVILLPGLPPKGDVSDWLAAGHTVEELEHLAETTRPWRPPSAVGIPEEGYIGIAADFADLYSEYTESPRPFLYMTFLAYLGSMISPKVTLYSELRPQPRIYMINLGSSADSRKSSSLGHVDAFFRRTFIGFGDYVHFGLGSAEGLARRLGRDPQTKEIKPLVVHLDEARVLTDKSRHDGSILLPMLASLFERNEFDNSTKTHVISIRDGYVSIVGACTPETYGTMWTTAFLDLGFTNRIWLVTGEATQRVALPREIPDGRRRAIASDLAGLLTRIEVAAGVDQLVLPLDDEARTFWEAWYDAMPRTIHSRRLDTYGWRLMILLSLSRGDLNAVSGDTVRRVCALLDHQLALRREFDPVDAENAVARMEELIRRQLRSRGSLTRRDLSIWTNARRYGGWMFSTALDNLMRARDVAYVRATKCYDLTLEARDD